MAENNQADYEVHTNCRVLVALDFNNPQDALAFADQVSPSQCRLKVGKELFTLAGPQLVDQLQQKGFEVFLDLKFHDIPNTVAAACKVAAEMGVWMVNIHASGGVKMMQAAKEAVASVAPKNGRAKTKLIAVTVLTSTSEQDFAQLGFSGSIEQQVVNLAKLTYQAGLDGVVCSAREAEVLRRTIGEDFLLVTPGIRPEGYAKDDQTRIVTPRQALINGSSYLVIGRPITKAENPQLALQQINQSIKGL
ncbi:orotidine-5'-phosphate decarboxylase [Pelagibaculum spongiae]|uniref:Orotidine 5'-phosphate decarboxylase n=1 Tax=Pelagibaculum spongiae TaxID=2080658 RepID=A0A2V1H368_9GAMM|nr:orotidine-5'-phosphate decarboxylase [Pelagibaculum spongiae]PVZ71617.1 orotidine-5'-phosphate decarboxylase [Pelagibaculum spongiae]